MTVHSIAWWRKHWERTGIVAIELADTMPDGWQAWLDWQRAVAPDNATEIAALEADLGRYLDMGYRFIGIGSDLNYVIDGARTAAGARAALPG